MHLRVLAVAIALTACSSSLQQRPCTDSVQARARGSYPAGWDAKAHEREKTYGPSCRQACAGGDQAQCLEGWILEIYATSNIRKPSIVKIDALCAQGYAPACAWVEANAERVAYQKSIKAADDAAMGAATATPMGAAVENLRSQMAAEGMALVDDTQDDLSDGYASFQTRAHAGKGWAIFVIGDPRYRFTANVVGLGTVLGELTEAPMGPGVFVRGVTVPRDRTVDAAVTIEIKTSGGGGGDIRILEFEGD